MVLRRFSPLDYAVELTGPVNCPFAGCVFSTERGVEMSHHQETSAHPGWHRLGGRAAERSWLCSFQGCGNSFFKWNNLYNHMMSHSKPLSCPECPFRTARGTRLRQHIEKNHPGCQSAPRRHFSKQSGSKFLKKPHQLVSRQAFFPGVDGLGWTYDNSGALPTPGNIACPSTCCYNALVSCF